MAPPKKQPAASKSSSDNKDDVVMKDSGEEEDEDYNPEEEQAEEEDDEQLVESTDTNTALSTMQLKKIDAAFEELFGYKWGTIFRLSEAKTRHERMLSRILGPTAAASVLQSNATIGVKRKSVVRKQQQYKVSSLKPADDAVKAAKVASKSNKSSPGPRRLAKKASSGGVDKILQDIAAPEKISTVAKTSTDWDQFKDRSGLGNKLEEQAESKDAYLKRQDFLTRVDHRQFELEKQDRDRERSKRGK